MPVLSGLEHPSVVLRLAGGEWSGFITLVENAFQAEKIKFLKQAKPAWQRINAYDGAFGLSGSFIVGYVLFIYVIVRVLYVILF